MTTDPRPTITVNNQSTVFEGQELTISCSTSYSAPLAPSAPPLTPSIYFSTSDGQRVSDVNLVVTSDQVKAFFSITAKFPVVPSFTCVVFFPTVNETKQGFASNTPNNTYSWSSPVINVSRKDFVFSCGLKAIGCIVIIVVCSHIFVKILETL